MLAGDGEGDQRRRGTIANVLRHGFLRGKLRTNYVMSMFNVLQKPHTSDECTLEHASDNISKGVDTAHAFAYRPNPRIFFN